MFQDKGARSDVTAPASVRICERRQRLWRCLYTSTPRASWRELRQTFHYSRLSSSSSDKPPAGCLRGMEASVVLTKDLDFSEQEGRSPESIHAAATDKLLSVTRVFFPRCELFTRPHSGGHNGKNSRNMENSTFNVTVVMSLI